VLATVSKVRGFKRERVTIDFKDDKIRSTTILGEKVKPSVPRRKFLQHVKEPCWYERDT
jgi:hypothetical protein